MSHDPRNPASVRPRSLPALWFLAALVTLGAIAIAALRMPPRIISGLPDDQVITAVRALVHGRVGVESGELRFESALLGEGGEANVALATEAEQTLRGVQTSHPFEPRRLAALAGLSLAAHRHSEAERLYRRAVDIAPSYGEARLGLGVTLALGAATGSGEDRARGLRLRAISQFAAVPEGDPGYPAALYDRVLLLVRVGRPEEARRLAREYFVRDPESTWASVLRRELDAAPH